MAAVGALSHMFVEFRLNYRQIKFANAENLCRIIAKLNKVLTSLKNVQLTLGGSSETIDAAAIAMAESWEPVANLIRRWSGTQSGGFGSGGRDGAIFVLAFVDELPVDVQQRTLDLIRQRAPFAQVNRHTSTRLIRHPCF